MDNINFLNKKSKIKIIPIASGKGGVGKTFLSSNLAVTLGKAGKNTVVIDMDIGGSNLHTVLGIKNSNKGIGSLITKRNIKLKDLLIETQYENLKLISGDILIPGVSDISSSKRRNIIKSLYELKCEYLIVDLGAGSSDNIVDFMLLSSFPLMVVTPQITSVLNAYSLAKNLIYRLLYILTDKDRKATNVINSFKRKIVEGEKKTVWDILNKIYSVNKKYSNQFKKIVEKLRIKLVVNMMQTKEDNAIIKKMISQIYQKLALKIDIIGILPYNQSVNYSIAKRVPIVSYNDESIITTNVNDIGNKIVDFSERSDNSNLVFSEKMFDEFDNSILDESEPKDDSMFDKTSLLNKITSQEKEINRLRHIIKILTNNKDV